MTDYGLVRGGKHIKVSSSQVKAAKLIVQRANGKKVDPAVAAIAKAKPLSVVKPTPARRGEVVARKMAPARKTAVKRARSVISGRPIAGKTASSKQSPRRSG